MPLQIDENEWPLVVVRWEGPLTDKQVDGILVAMDRWLAREQRFGYCSTRGVAADCRRNSGRT